MEVQSELIDGPTGSLQVLSSLPGDSWLAPGSSKPAVILVHGSFCSAHCYVNFLPYLARHGHPAYALSIRGHGGSQSQSWTQRMVLTTLASWGEDTKALVAHVVASHPNTPPPVLAGHSLGGGAVQHMLALGLLRPFEISAVVLLASSPLSGGGGDIGANWKHVEAPEGHEHYWSRRGVLDTVDQVRASFFTERTSEKIVQAWLDKSKTAEESARVGMRISWAVGAPRDVLNNLTGLKTSGRRRKMLFVAGGSDPLVPPEMVWKNAKVYEDNADAKADGDATCERVLVEKSGHHLMMDEPWEECAQYIVRWLDGKNIM